MPIRRATEADRGPLLEIWLASVRATHHFLTPDDIAQLLPLVRDDALPHLELWVITDDDGTLAGFMGLDGPMVEALFIAPASFRRGLGRQLIEHARRLKGALKVDVNEQNPEAVKFYLACGFEIVGRSPVDSGGRPFPLLHLHSHSIVLGGFEETS